MENLRPTSSETHSVQIPETAISNKAPVPQFDLEDFYCILQNEPNDSLMALELARRLTRRGRREEALKILKSVVRMDYRFETILALANLEYQMDLIDPAFTHFQEALLIAPETSEEFFELFKNLGNIFMRKGDLDSAEDSYNKAFRIQPNSDALRVNLGTLYIQKHKWDEALTHFREALELNSKNDKAWVGLALGHRVKGDWELAWGNIEAALEYNPLNEVALSLAVDWGAKEGREFRTLEMIREFLISGGWNEDMSLAFAWLSWRRGDKDIAVIELERLLAVNPGNGRALSLANEMRQAS